MRRSWFLLLSGLLAANGLARSDERRATDASVRAFVERHCLVCHQGPAAQRGLDLGRLLEAEPEADTAARWSLVARRVARGEMPPPGADPVPASERETFLAALGAAPPTAPPPPRRPVLRRLNAAEYERAVRDLLGVAVDARHRLPADDVGEGFDVVGDVLAMPPALLEKYFLLAEEIARRAVPPEEGEAPPTLAPRLEDLEIEGGGRYDVRGAWGLYSRATLSHVFELPREGRYRIRVSAFGQQAGPEPARMAVRVEGTPLEIHDVEATGPEGTPHETVATLPSGPVHVAVAFVNDYYRPDATDPKQRDRNLVVTGFELEGPLDPQARRPGALLVLPPRPEGVSETRHLERAVAALARRAWRAPVSEEDLSRLLEAVEAGVDPDATVSERMRVAVAAILTSPRFLYRLEVDPPGAEGPTRALDDHELATRLAAFLWSSVPDEALLDLADAGRLSNGAVLSAEVDRMLADARATALSERFAPQWLRIQELGTPDPASFPEADGALLAAMREETIRLFDAVLREDRDVRTLLDADFTFVNEALADLYGLPGVRGPHLRRVALPPGTPGGVLAHASVLRATSNPTRTSPVKRGKWVLEALLDQPPPPPPPGVGALPEDDASIREATLRERLARHRADPACAVCHARMDPLGLALENFDAIGRWREVDGEGRPLDTHATLPDGRALDGLAGLQAFLRSDPSFFRSLSRHLLVYALGRGVGPGDEAALEHLEAVLKAEPTLRALIHAVVELDAFRRTTLAPRPEERR